MKEIVFTAGNITYNESENSAIGNIIAILDGEKYKVTFIDLIGETIGESPVLIFKSKEFIDNVLLTIPKELYFSQEKNKNKDIKLIFNNTKEVFSDSEIEKYKNINYIYETTFSMSEPCRGGGDMIDELELQNAQELPTFIYKKNETTKTIDLYITLAFIIKLDSRQGSTDCDYYSYESIILTKHKRIIDEKVEEIKGKKCFILSENRKTRSR